MDSNIDALKSVVHCILNLFRHSLHWIFGKKTWVMTTQDILEVYYKSIRYNDLHIYSIYLASGFDTDTHISIAWMQWHEQRGSALLGRWTANEHGEANIVYFDHFFLSSWMKTLTTLDLQHNSIGDEGARYLASALQTNKVGLFLCSWIICSFISSY